MNYHHITTSQWQINSDTFAYKKITQMCQILKGILNPSRIAKLLDPVSNAIGKIFINLVIYF